jgi:3-oxoacyl-[acyl-carrier protein] reductase
MTLSYSARTALVLGGSKGLGFAIAEGLARAGVKVALTSRDVDGAAKSAARIGDSAHGYACDTGDLASIEKLHADVTRNLGGIDVLVLNSGGPKPGGAQNVSPETWRSAFEAMFVGPVRLADLALPGMIERGFGRILSIISSGVIEPIPNLAVSNTIRPALVGWGKTLATEVASKGITVNAIAPGRIATDRLASLDQNNAERQGKSVEAVQKAAQERIPVGRYGQPEEFAAMALFLASDQAAFVTGSVLRVDGGQIAATI